MSDSDEPRKPFCEWCDTYHPAGQHESRGRVIAAVLAEVARMAGEDGEGMSDAEWDSELFDICQVALAAPNDRALNDTGRNAYDYTVQLVALALARAMRLNAGDAT